MQVVYEKIRNQDEWFKSVNNNRALREWEVIITRIVRNNESKEIKFPGYCTVCDSDVEFELNDRYSADVLNFRESLMCPSCHLNNRQRAMVSLLKENVTPCSHIYI